MIDGFKGGDQTFSRIIRGFIFNTNYGVQSLRPITPKIPSVENVFFKSQ